VKFPEVCQLNLLLGDQIEVARIEFRYMLNLYITLKCYPTVPLIRKRSVFTRDTDSNMRSSRIYLSALFFS
jgi:hypothetical protein